jgi:hypothetical protein
MGWSSGPTSPRITYPGAKNNLAPEIIIPMLDPTCTRFVDACAGRGSKLKKMGLVRKTGEIRLGSAVLEAI